MTTKINRRRFKGTGYIFSRNGIYYLHTTINGKRKLQSLKTKSKKEAEIEAQKLLPVLNAKTKEELIFHLGETRKLFKKNTVTIAEMWDLYQDSPSRPKSNQETLNKYEYKFKRFIDWIKNKYPQIKTLGQLTNNIAKEYARDLWGSGIAAKTYNDHIAALRLAIRVLHDVSDSENPFNHKNISKETNISEIRKEFTESEVIKILDSFDQNNFSLLNKYEMKVLFNIVAWTGQRLKDCALIKWESINFSRNLITMVPSKTRKFKKTVNIPIHPALKNVLIMAKSWRTNEYVLPNVAHRYVTNPAGISKDATRVLTYNGFKTKIEVADRQRKLKANHYGLHSFRHSFVSFCANAGVPMPAVIAIIGDGSPVIYKHYVHIGQKSIETAINALPVVGYEESTREKINKLLDTASEKDLKRYLALLRNNTKSVAELPE